MSSTGALMTYLGVSFLLIPVALFFVFYNGGDPGGSDDPAKNSWLFWRKFIGYGILAVYGMAFLAVIMIISHHFFGLGVNAAVLIGLAIIGVVVLNPYWDRNGGYTVPPSGCMRSH